MKILVLNAGSSSMKCKLYETESRLVLAEANCQRVGAKNGEIKFVGPDGAKQVFQQDMPDHEFALARCLELLTSGKGKVIDNIREIDAVGHRVANGGTSYVNSVRIDEGMIRAMEALVDITPLHTPPQLSAIRACQKLFGADFPMVAGFDTAFHQTLAPEVYTFPIPYRYYERHGVRRLCFHGLSHEFVMERYFTLTGRPRQGSRLVTCHLGGGSSVTAIKDGKSADNSFGFGSGEGIISGTRAGSLDHTAIAYIMQKENTSFEEMQDILHRESGLMGISGISGDEKELEDLALAGNARAKLAIDCMTLQVKKHIGAYAFEIGGLDAVIFTGGIGENSDYCRGLICQGLEEMGIRLDEKANVEFNRREHKISAPDSKVEVWIIPTNEELIITRDTQSIIQGSR